MVLVQSVPQSRNPHVQPNPSRILGMAGALAIPAAALMALMLPTEIELPKLVDKFVVNPTIVQLEKKPDVVPVIRPEQEKPRPTPPQAQPRVVQPVPQPPVLTRDAGPMDPPLPPPQTEPAYEASTQGPTMAPDPAPIAGVRLEYAKASPPPYPREEMLSGRQGTVLLQILVDVDGRPLEVSIHQSSGSRELDRAALRHVQKSWTFKPAMKDGHPVQAIGIVPIEFKLQ